MAPIDDLRLEIAVLEAQLLSQFDTEFPDPPSLEEVIRLNAYLVLAHGCLEEHIEALFHQHAAELSAELARATVSRAVAMAAFAWQEAGKQKPFRERSLEDIIKSGPSLVEKAARSNNGIKESNIETLAKSAGVEWPTFEAHCNTAIAALETLGGKRGSVAHVSASRTQITQSPVYPDEAKGWVEDAIQAAESVMDYLATTRRV